MYLYGNNIVLIGFMGSGKSTVGKRAAEVFGLNCVDIDEEIKKQYAMNISEIFNNFGEKSFRDTEKKNIRLFSYQRESIISTGGGTIIDTDNVKMLKQCGIVIHLKASVDTIIKNLTNDNVKSTSDRPLLNSKDLQSKITEILNTRKELYQRACHYEIVVDDLSVEQIVEKLFYIVDSFLDYRTAI